jgi:hypothetical protein
MVGNLAVSPVPLADRQQAAAYVAALTGELAGLVRRHRLDTLGYILDLARLEAEEAVQQAAQAAEHLPAEPANGTLNQRKQAAAMAFDPSGEFKLEQHGSHKRRR